jgi:N-methylhydantoinase A
MSQSENRAAGATAWRAGVDVGGTFTDLVAVSAEGDLFRAKVASTPRAPEEGLLASLRALFETIDPPALEYIGHASTIATNALLGQVHLELPRVAFLTTAGFRDVIEIGRQNRSSVYDLNVRRPRPLAARADRIAVRERIAHDGRVLVPLTGAAIAEAVEAVAARGVTTVAVGFLNSYRNNEHEVAIGEAIRRALPDVAVTLSAELVREEREYERFSTALVNAALIPIVRRYLERVERGARAPGTAAPVFVMQSSGGMAAIDVAAQRPATLVESGPAGGVIAAAAVGTSLGIGDVLSFDMGGTTAKAGTIIGGTPEIAYEFEAAGATHSGRASKGSGYPVRFPFVDLAEISAGGGTIARLDAAGVLRVGPLSAGADPGPACYGRGNEPTVTDANVVLGRLNPIALVGGTFPIDAARARDAIASVAAPLGGDVARTAAGIVELVDAEMAKVLRIVSVERGLDPRDFVLMAFGGGGPLHACALAEDLGMTRVIVPVHPGLFSAYGLLAAQTSAVRSRALLRPLSDAAAREAAHLERELAAEAQAALREQGAGEVSIVGEIGARYAGQSFDLTVPFDSPDQGAIARAFHAKHEARYGYSARDETIELTAVRVTAKGGSNALAAAPRVPANEHDGAYDLRQVWDRGRFVLARVIPRDRLVPGSELDGPAIVEQYDTTTWLPGGWRARTERLGNLVLERL